MKTILTKSMFVRSLGCPAKLFYAARPEEYPDNAADDDFMRELAKGGYQVGALAQKYFAGGILVGTLDRDAAVQRTTELLGQRQVTVFEGAIRYNNLLVRADILVRNGRRIDLIEVKAKSYDDDSADGFLGKRGGIASDWKKYLYDVAFQTYVLRKAFPDNDIRPYLMLADKRKDATVDGLNQLFRVRERAGRLEVMAPAGDIDTGERVLVQVAVDGIVNDLIEGAASPDTMDMIFSKFVDQLAKSCAAGTRIDVPVGPQCAGCEYCASPEQEARGLKNGFKECWRRQMKLKDADFQAPGIFDLWDYRKKDEIIASGRYRLNDLTDEDIPDPEKPGKEKPGLTHAARQRLQLAKVKQNDTTPYLDKEGLCRAVESWRFPLHFIDFETSAMALPFHKGRHPYEAIAFQFSHHVVDAAGQIAHVGEYIEATPGCFPNYAFLRALKAQLDEDEGSIFMYATHENTTLIHIYYQLKEESRTAVPDRDLLCEWIRSVTRKIIKNHVVWEGPRALVDMRELVLRYHYDPQTGGSNSLKAVLPAVLASSKVLQQKYSRPVYGAARGIASRNYRDWTWVRKDAKGVVADPYSLLEPLSTNLTPEQLEFIDEDESLADGAAAMMAYARLQFVEMQPAERQALIGALLKYCELDTFAMVLLWEYWKEECGI